MTQNYYRRRASGASFLRQHIERHKLLCMTDLSLTIPTEPLHAQLAIFCSTRRIYVFRPNFFDLTNSYGPLSELFRIRRTLRSLAKRFLIPLNNVLCSNMLSTADLLRVYCLRHFYDRFPNSSTFCQAKSLDCSLCAPPSNAFTALGTGHPSYRMTPFRSWGPVSC